jgi:glycosyltransferase involved in cell wall biosynthesis
MHVLLIAHYFPPDGGAGSQRPASFAQHLPALGCETTVVCRQVDDAKRGAYDPADRTLLARTASGATIRRASAEPGETWTAALLREARDAVRAHRPDVVVVTLSPFEHAEIGFALRDEFRVPVVLDLRDPWALDGWHTYRHHFAWRRSLQAMRHALGAADGVVMNVPGARTAAESIAPRRGLTPYGVVTNGWEEDDFASTPDVPQGDKFRIRFAGTFVCRFMRDRSLLRRLRARLRGRGEVIDERGRSPLFLLEAIRALRESRGADAAIGRDFVLELAGAKEAETQQIIDESGCADAVAQLGYLPHDQSARFIAGAHALLLPMHGLPRGARARMVPGKLYEYFGTGRPILGLCPEGDARDWIARDPRSRVANPVDSADIAAKLRELHAMWRSGELADSSRAPWTGEFTRRTQAERLVEYLRAVIGPALQTQTRTTPVAAPAALSAA